MATVHPNGMFTDNMVLQREQTVLVYGEANEGEQVRVEINGQCAETVSRNGQWQVELKPMPASGPHVLEIEGENTVQFKNVMIGDVWMLGGQSNMARRLNSYAWLMSRLPELEENEQIRMFKILENAVADEPSKELIIDPAFENSWQQCRHELIERFSPLGYFFAVHYQKRTGVAVGVIHASRGATLAESWVPMPVLESRPEYADILDPEWNTAYRPEKDGSPNVRRPTVLYNGTVHPLQPYTIKGVLWNQGESDSRYSKRYRTLFPDLIRTWRNEWGQGDFPFIYAQLSSNKDRTWSLAFEPKESSWAWQREAQAYALNEPNTAMVASHDIGEWEDIHPQDKETLAERYILAAAKLDGEDVVASGPVYKSYRVDGNRILVSFSELHSGLESRRVAMNKNKGLEPGTDTEAFVAPANELMGFIICGADQQFHEAQAAIVGDEVAVWCDEVKEPVAVRYAWATFALANLYNEAGLPAFPFRTDDFAQIQIVAEKKPKAN